MKVRFRRQRSNGVKGTLGIITSNEIRGWAFYPNNWDSTVKLDVRVNGKLVGTAVADRFREGLKTMGKHPSGNCGYVFRFDTPLQQGDKVEITDTLHGLHLSGSPGHFRAYVRNKGRINQPMGGQLDPDVRLFFIHVPKTAGTTFRHMLYERFDQDEIYPNQAMIKENDGYPSINEFLATPPERLVSPVLFMGHYPFAIHKMLGENVQKLVFLREPVARTISNLNHFKNLNPNHKESSLQQIYGKAKIHMSNLQTRLFCKTDLSENLNLTAPPVITAEHLEVAKKNLELCEFIGVTERFAESVELANRLYDFEFDEIQSLNVTRQKQDVSREFIEELRYDNRFDTELYEFGVRLFEQLLNRSQ